MVGKEKLCFSFSAAAAIVGSILTWASLVTREVFLGYCELIERAVSPGGLNVKYCLLNMGVPMTIGILMMVFGVFYASRIYWNAD